MSSVPTVIAAMAAIATVTACSSSKPAVSAADSAAAGSMTYVAELQPLNTSITGMQTTGEAKIVINGDSMTITTDVKGVSPSMMHLQHFHGFADNRDAICPTPAADTNHDGVIDINETEPVLGVTMVPFTSDPVSMQIVTNTYPTADSAGVYHYSKTVSLPALDSAFKKTFNGAALDLASRVVMIHGVPASMKLKPSVSSLGDIPAQVTIPIACGKLVKSGS
ncbi:MAG: hypothetical protein ABI026_10665 [Gemmatimonadaceae bacterium]